MTSGHLNQYDRYYMDQAGSGMAHYKGTPNMRGHGGIGQFLSGLFRSVMPMFRSGARALGREALRTGSNVVSDLLHDKPFKHSLKSRLREGGTNLHTRFDNKINSMNGSGLKRAKRRRISQSKGKARTGKTSAKRKKTSLKTLTRNKRKRKAPLKRKTKRTVKKRKTVKKRQRKKPSLNINDIFS
jgi:hypothetical protein